MKLLNGTKGQTLIEVLVALGVAGLVLSAIGVSIGSALNNTQFSKNQNTASQYAQEGMEQVRKLRDSQWATFSGLVPSNGVSDYCLDQGSATFKRAGSECSLSSFNIDNTFVRKISLEKNGSPCSGNATKVVVSVSWTDNKCTGLNLCHNVTLSSCLSTTFLVPTP